MTSERRSDAEVAKWCRDNPQRPFCENDGKPCPMSEGCPYRQIHLRYTQRFPLVYDRREMADEVMMGVTIVSAICAVAALVAMVIVFSRH